MENERIQCDVVILGGGPAGLTAAIYCGRARLNTIVLEQNVPGGQAASTYHIANYPGTPGVIEGTQLTAHMEKQAESFDARIVSGVSITEVNLTADPKIIKSGNSEFLCRAVIIATGAQPRKLEADGAKTFKARGVHYCATCDGPFYQGKKVIVVGGGNSALQEAIFLTKFAEEVIIVHILDNFQGSKVLQEEVAAHPNIKVKWTSKVKEILGDLTVTGVKIENVATCTEEKLTVEGVFVYIGTKPQSELFEGQLDLDEAGYIITDGETRTKVAGVFAAGDIRKKEVRQVVTAAGDGATAAVLAEKYLVH